MKLVGAALGDQRDLTAGGTALVGALSADRDAKLLHGVERNRQRGVEARLVGNAIGVRSVGEAVCRRIDTGILVVVHVDAIERDVVLVALRSEHLAGRRNTGLHAQQLNHVARLQRKLPDLRFGEGVSDGSICSVDSGDARLPR